MLCNQKESVTELLFVTIAGLYPLVKAVVGLVCKYRDLTKTIYFKVHLEIAFF